MTRAVDMSDMPLWLVISACRSHCLQRTASALVGSLPKFFVRTMPIPRFTVIGSKV